MLMNNFELFRRSDGAAWEPGATETERQGALPRSQGEAAKPGRARLELGLTEAKRCCASK